MKPNVVCSEVGSVAYLTLTGPRKNALAREMHHALAAQLDRLKDRADIEFIVLRGAGGVFSSGGDVTQLADGLPESYVDDYMRRMEGTIGAMRQMDQIVIAAIEGAAIGAAAALALSADIVIAEEDAKIRLSFVRLGFVPDAGATYLLPRAVGGARASDLLMTGRWISVAEACSAGLVSRSCEHGSISEAVEGVLDELRQSPPHALAMTKHLINRRDQTEFMAAVREEGESQPVAAALTSSDVADAVLNGVTRDPQPTGFVAT
ncbi:enoyl-CoA hydratase/isomerase family protein [Microbacterium sp. Root61]|uniref:enoyl-CoA hydratase/isomerase family protein n=1 Tax=Microbacterium sp. Root61 TaxID=1736570 RepID=UPI000A60AC13|nr:enoyl-CoA hydratase/isomerase family protein [Microbacterium sp. Root61]